MNKSDILSNKKFSIGLILVIIGVHICMNYYLIIFGFPIYLAGVFFIIFSKSSIQKKLNSTIIPAVLWLPVVAIVYYFAGKTTPETFLIPENFNGKFIVIYGERCGINPKIENGRRILNIPQNGVLIIQPEFEGGRIDHEYYLVNKNGNRKPVSYPGVKDKKKRFPRVYFKGSGSVGGEMPDGSNSSESPYAYEYSEFEVENKFNSLRQGFNEIQRFDSLASAVMKECRDSFK